MEEKCHVSSLEILRKPLEELKYQFLTEQFFRLSCPYRPVELRIYRFVMTVPPICVKFPWQQCSFPLGQLCKCEYAHFTGEESSAWRGE